MGYARLLRAIKERPEPYEAGEVLFWDDPHISKGMLDAHLNPDLESASRKHEQINASARWISSLTSSNKKGHLLDLGCGPGLYTDAFLKQGFEVRGIDFSKRSIAYAQEHARIEGLNIEYCYEDYLKADFGEGNQIITLIYCDFGVLSPSNRMTLLRKIYSALEKGGLFIFDGFSTHHFKEAIESEHITYEKEGFWRPHPYVCIKRDYCYEDTADYLEQYIIVDEDDCKCYNVWNHAFDKHEMVGMMKAEGFSDLSFFGNAAGAPFDDVSDTICVVARK